MNQSQTIVACILIFLLGGGVPTSLSAQGGEADPAEAKVRFEQAFEAALTLPAETEPIMVLQTWGSVMMMGFMAEHLRSGAAGETVDAAVVNEGILARLEERDPDSGLPHLLRLLNIRDQAEKRRAVHELATRYQDDPIVTWQAAQTLRAAEEFEAATEVVDRFVRRNPAHPLAFRLLDGSAMNNESRRAEILKQWAETHPGDPALVSRWLGSPVARLDEEATASVLRAFFSRSPGGADGLAACLSALRRSDFKNQARACIARIAFDPSELETTAERARTELLKIAAEHGELTDLLEALDTLRPEIRAGALIRAAETLEAPRRCDERLELLAAAADSRSEEDDSLIASALRPCVETASGQKLLLELLETTPAERLRSLATSLVIKVNGRYRGDLPPAAAEVLRRREAAEAPSEQLYRALELVLLAQGREAERLDLLRRWSTWDPASLGSEQAIDLAMHLAADDAESAINLLRSHQVNTFDADVVEALFGLMMSSAEPARAGQLAAELRGSDQPWRAQTGHLLSARAAAVDGDFTRAETHYEKALAGQHPRSEVAVELLAMLRWGAGRGDLEAVARRLCAETRLADSPRQIEACAAELLVDAGDPAAAEPILVAQAEDLPDDPRALRERAAAAAKAGRTDLQEAALRRVLEIDPKSEQSWSDLGLLLEKTGRVEALVALLDECRQALPSVPLYLSRSAARALTVAGEPARALDILLAARSDQVDSPAAEWALSWIDHESDEAYRALGQSLTPPASTARPEPSLRRAPSPESGLSAHELRLAADRLQSGAGGVYDPRTAQALYRQAAEGGDARAIFRLALLRQFGLSTDGEAPPLGARARADVEELASSGDAYSQYLLGSAAMIGLGGEVDDRAAWSWLEAAAAGGESWAMHNLAYLRQSGRGEEPPDFSSVIDAYRRASEVGNVRSMLSFAALTLTHDNTGPICMEGLSWLEKSAAAGEAQAAALLGKLLFYGRAACVARRPAEAMGWLEAAARAGQAGADFDLALAQLLSEEAEPRRLGLDAMRRIASRPDTLALETLAFLRATGEGLTRDVAAADRLIDEAVHAGSDGFPRLREERRWSRVFVDLLDRGLRRLEGMAARNDAAAMAMLARMHSAGLVESSDLERVVTLARQAAEQGRADAMRILSRALRRGEGVAVDVTAADRWRTRCADAKESFCMMFLGQALISGEGVPRDLEAGSRWLNRAAEAGNYWAIQDLSRLYDRGAPGFERDPEKAAAWKKELAAVGDSAAIGWLAYHGQR